MLGMCPTLAVTSSAINGLGMGLTTTAVLILSNAFISLLRKVIPDKVRIPAFIVIVASFVTIIQLLLQGYMQSLNKALGVYIPLIVVNCIILGRAEAYASKILYFHQYLTDLVWDLVSHLVLHVSVSAVKFWEVVLYLIISLFLRDYHITFFVLAPEHSLFSHSLRHCRTNSKCLLLQMLRQMIQISPVAVTAQAV